MVSGSVSLPLLGFFSPFPHGTGSLSVVCEYLALEGGPPGFERDFTCPALLRNENHPDHPLTRTGLSPSLAGLSRPFRFTDCPGGGAAAPPVFALQPRRHNAGRLACHRFGLFPFRSPLLRESRLISLPRGTEMFHFPRLPRTGLCIQPAVTGLRPAGFPHSEIAGSNACLRLPGAYRSLPRPSSTADAKASTMRP